MKQTTCNCEAYPFPHREGGGDCQEPTRERDGRDDWQEYYDWKYDEGKIKKGLRG